MRLLILLVFCIQTFVSRAQTPILTWGENNYFTDDVFAEKIIGYTDSTLAVLYAYNSSFFKDAKYLIGYHDTSNFKLVEFVELINVNLEKTDKLEDAEIIDGEVVVFFSDFDERARSNLLRAYIVYKDGFIEFKPLVEFEAFAKSRAGNFPLSITKDKKHFLAYSKPPFEKQQKREIQYSIFSHRFKEVESRNIEIPYYSSEFEVVSLEIDNALNVYFLVKITDLFKRWNKGQPNFKYIVLKVPYNSKDIIEFEINLFPRSISDVVLKLIDNEIVVCGLYSNSGNLSSESSGVFLTRISKDSNYILSRSTIDFSADTFEKMKEGKADSKNEIPGLYIKAFVVNSNKNFHIILEQYFKNTVCYTDPQTGIINCKENFSYQNLISMITDSLGNELHQKITYKNQFSSEDYGPYSSVLPLIKNNQAVYLYNENPKNIDLDTGEKRKKIDNFRKSIPVSINAFSESQELIALEPPPEKYIFKPKLFFRKSNDRYIIYSENNRENCFGKIKLE